MSELAKKLIKESKRIQSHYLDLGNCGLDGTEEVLAELADLPDVTTLVFSNKWEEYKGQKWVTGYSKNFSSPNHLVQLPVALPPHLQTLIIAGGWGDYWEIKNLSPLVGLAQLQSLNVSGNQLTDLSPLVGLSQLQSLDVSHNQLTDLSLSGLPQLQSLNVSHNQLTDLTLLAGLAQLQSLDISKNQLKDLSPLAGLSQLRSLDIDNNQLTDLSPLSGLSQLQNLNVNLNQLTDLSSLEGLTQLRSLNIDNNRLTDLSSLEGLTQLRSLNIRSNQLTDLSPLAGLSQLRSLNIDNNRLTNLAPLAGLPQLQRLGGSSNQLTDLSPLAGLSQLQSLDVRRNYLMDLSPLAGLPQLQSLDANYNQLTDVSFSSIKSFSKLNELHLRSNPLTNIPPEIFDEYNCLKAVTRYFEDLAQGKKKIYQQKLILIGNGRVGKTSLVRRWLDNAFNEAEPSTHAIQLRPHFLPQLADAQSLDQVQLNIWDFGGQDIYHSTHRLFMQSKALFVLVWDAETEGQETQEENLEDGSLVSYPNHPLAYWLNYADSLGQGSPVLVVQTKKARDGEQPPPHWLALKQQYPQIVEHVAVEASWDDEDDNGFAQLKFHLEQTLKKQIKKSCTDLPASWWKVRQAIAEKMGQGLKTLSQPTFAQICEQRDLDSASLTVLRDYLHSIGFLFYRKGLFHDEIIIDQRWAIEAVYTLLDRQGMFMEYRGKGFFKGKDLGLNPDWKGKTMEEQELLVSFMESCEICVEVGEGWVNINERIPFVQRQYLAPQLLPDDPIPNIGGYFPEGAQGLYMKITHPFLHASVLHRFILRYVHQIEPNNMKQHRVYLTYSGLRVLLEAFPAQHAIVVRLAADQSEESNYYHVLYSIRKELREIQKAVEGVKEWVSTNSKDYVLWEDLHKHPRDNPKIVADNGQHCDFADFKMFLEDFNSKPDTMTNDTIPPEVKSELERMVTQEHEKVLRYRALKNAQKEEEKRQVYQAEIELSLRNIEEIKQDFLGKIQSANTHLSTFAIQQSVDEVSDQVMKGLSKAENTPDKETILRLIDQNIYQAIGELAKIIKEGHEAYGLFMDYRTELLSKRANFQKEEFRATLKLFVETYL